MPAPSLGRNGPFSRPLRLLLSALVAMMVTVTPAALWAHVQSPKVAIIVGPVGEGLTPQYIELAQLAAAAAERAGAVVARAYSPHATPRRVLAAVEGANVVIYFGHGTGFPNPYSDVPHGEKVNGWGLQGPGASGTHDDSLGSGSLAYYGASWLVAHARPAPGFVMIYSNACYAPGASEGGLPVPHRSEALAHVANYSAPAFEMGASAYYATDFYGGAATLVGQLLQPRPASFGAVFRRDPNFEADALIRLRHPLVAGARIWLHRSAYFDGQVNYWYAFAGHPGMHPGAGPLAAPGRDGSLPLIGLAGRAGFEAARGSDRSAVVLVTDSVEGTALPRAVGICADRCALVRVVASQGTDADGNATEVALLSAAAWRLVSDAPLARSRIPVRLYLDGLPPPDAGILPLVLSVEIWTPRARHAHQGLESLPDASDSVSSRRLAVR